MVHDTIWRVKNQPLLIAGIIKSLDVFYFLRGFYRIFLFPWNFFVEIFVELNGSKFFKIDLSSHREQRKSD
jgi:hypothetical protein